MLPLTACGTAIPGADQTQPAQPGTAAPATSTSAARQPTAAQTPREPLPEEQPVATRDLKTETGLARAEVFPIKREDKATVVTVKVEAVKGTLESRTVESKLLTYSPDGMSLVDGEAGMIHLPSTIDGSAICGPHMVHGVDEGQVFYATCVFGPLPASTSAVTLRFGQFGEFDAVPVR